MQRSPSPRYRSRLCRNRSKALDRADQNGLDQAASSPSRPRREGETSSQGCATATLIVASFRAAAIRRSYFVRNRLGLLHRFNPSQPYERRLLTFQRPAALRSAQSEPCSPLPADRERTATDEEPPTPSPPRARLIQQPGQGVDCTFRVKQDELHLFATALNRARLIRSLRRAGVANDFENPESALVDGAVR